MAVVYTGKMSDGSIGPHGIDLDVYPLGKPVKIGEKPYDSISSSDIEDGDTKKLVEHRQ
jgi:hypothetical protein